MNVQQALTVHRSTPYKGERTVKRSFHAQARVPFHRSPFSPNESRSSLTFLDEVVKAGAPHFVGLRTEKRAHRFAEFRAKAREVRRSSPQNVRDCAQKKGHDFAQLRTTARELRTYEPQKRDECNGSQHETVRAAVARSLARARGGSSAAHGCTAKKPRIADHGAKRARLADRPVQGCDIRRLRALPRQAPRWVVLL